MPNRIIKESICTSETLAELSDFEFRLWVGLITQVDDAGRGDARPAIIKGRVFPLRERVTVKEIDNALHGLAAKGCVSLYTVGGRPYLWFPTWSEHQRIRDVKPKYPGPEDADKKETSAADCGGLPQIAADCGLNPIQSNPNPNPNTNPNPIQSNPTSALRIVGVEAVLADYLNRINPAASPMSLDELKGYAEVLGEAVCKRAFDIALDSKKTTWPYIRAILRRLQSQGVRCLADWETIERARTENEKKTKRSDGNVFMEMLEESNGTK